MSEYLGCLGLDVLISMARWDFWIRVLEKILIVQEHEILFDDFVFEDCVKTFREMDV